MLNDGVHNKFVKVGNATLYAGEIVTLDELRTLPDPERLGPKHYPMRFDMLIDSLHKALSTRGMGIKEQVIGLAKKRQRMVLALNIDSDMNRPDFGMHIGMFSSTDQGWANKLAFGTNVFVCANIGLSAEYVFRRKSTVYAIRDIPKLMNHGISKYVNHFSNEAKYLEQWMEVPISENQAKIFCWDALSNKVVNDARHMFKNVWPRFLKPDYEEHRPGTVFSLMNAFTGAQKERGGNPARVTKDSVNLMGFLKQRFPVDKDKEKEVLNINAMGGVDIVTNML